ncbi:MAG: hypothetical protein Q9216_002043 [Gyalolechia sp. 2 TL-2023]
MTEDCFVNIIGALWDSASCDFAGSKPIANYRTTCFLQPLIKINVPNLAHIQRKYLVSGVFLTAYHLLVHNNFHNLVLQPALERRKSEHRWRPRPRVYRRCHQFLTLSPGSDFQISHAHLATRVIRKGAVFMIIASPLIEAVPLSLRTRIQSTWIDYMRVEQCTPVIASSKVATAAAGLFFINEDLIHVLT